jgi:hypothetical protein
MILAKSELSAVLGDFFVILDKPALSQAKKLRHVRGSHESFVAILFVRSGGKFVSPYDRVGTYEEL